MIQGVSVVQPKVFRDDRGAVLRMLRIDDPHFAGFGEVYFSIVRPGVVKGWKRHREMTMALSVPCGKVLLVLYDDRPGSVTCGSIQQIVLSPEEHRVVVIPPMLWNGFMGLGGGDSVVTNCASILHRPDEADTCNAHDPAIPFRWPALVPS